MRTFVALVISSATFGAAIAIAYWIVAHREPTGTWLLGIMTAAFIFAAGFALIAERNASLSGDNAQLTAREGAGEDLGIFTSGSAWPILIAVCASLVLVGVIYSPLLAVVALIGLGACILRMGAESNRV